MEDVAAHVERDETAHTLEGGTEADVVVVHFGGLLDAENSLVARLALGRVVKRRALGLALLFVLFLFLFVGLVLLCVLLIGVLVVLVLVGSIIALLLLLLETARGRVKASSRHRDCGGNCGARSRIVLEIARQRRNVS